MLKTNWKSTALLAGISAVSAIVLLSAVIDTVDLALFRNVGIGSWLLLLVIAIASSPLTVRVASHDGILRGRESIADSFVLLAVMLYAVPPSNSAGPAVLLAAVVAFVSTFRIGTNREVVLKMGMAVVSTFIAASLYGALNGLFSGGSESPAQGALPLLNVFLIPLLVVAALQYALSTIATAWFISFEAGKFTFLPTPETVVWTLTTKLAGAASALLFYAAVLNQTLAYAVLGLLISALVYLLYRFNERRLEQIRDAEAERRRHAEEMATIHMNTIESLAIAIDAKDQTTHGHVRRTQLYATQMGKLFNVPESELRALHAGALLHDIGKLAVPEYILNKPGKLTEAEFAKMKIHPVVGGDILKRVNFPYPVEDIVRYHHEKWDGSGYPKGLRAEGIPLVARIISVVDFYDATRCDRPYRKGMKREESLALLHSMVGSAFDPKVVDIFSQHVEEFDRMIDLQDIKEQVESAATEDTQTSTKPDAGLASDILGVAEEGSPFRSISEAQREVFALHEIAQTIGSSLNLSDTVTLVANKLRAIVPFDTCVIYLVDERSGKAIAAHVLGEEVEVFKQRRINIGDGITGWVIANARSMCNASPELDLIGVPDEVVKRFRGVLVSPLLREDGAFGAIALYSQSRTSYSTEHVRLLESVCQHASSALSNALTYEKTRDSALIDPLTELPNARGFYMMLEQRLAECQRMNKEPLAVVCMDIDDFKIVNDKYGHSIGDRLLASFAGVVRSELRQMDILTRYAGDEFVAIMPMASSKMAGSIGERMRNAVEDQLFSVRTGTMVGLGVSLGVACFPDDGETSEELLSAAARRMQTDKNSRKTMLTVASAGVSSIDMMT
ncbi:MAG TPA: diguanylate cyclase [Pyrinomonadaceae bacterium]|nr:diguanylate cyclase [Pyrinomonadaceae bacterium]